ncbi:hypothetical protein SDRG_07487 [Saprolegnia diclina VS20]|uniref:RING-type domain-containing protein n=1 Tax=Saprolegnia diclina (strain VS20) TaxID=1156394 RepID=T0QN51_SAPDV|nr:hypothetical protein SDRG_07487 [Saprolegnia diclina VS20]EQC35260.1 hypothetical protein SDRG_07487 [Saprolegnia diclina VS20]|eukprot:XP_008611544.1 hypothetical protein SDRG_07487 [Saprolegnia diclina VS20]
MPPTRSSAMVPSVTSARGRTRSAPTVATRARTQGSREAAERRLVADLELENAQCKVQIADLEDELEAMEDTAKELADARKSLTQAAIERKEVEDTWKKQVQALKKRLKSKKIALKKQVQTQRASVETLTTSVEAVRQQLADEKGRVADLERQLHDEKSASRSWKDRFEQLSARSATAEQEEKADAPDSVSTTEQQPSRHFPGAIPTPASWAATPQRITRPRPSFSDEAPAGQRPRLHSPTRPPPAPQAQAATPITMQQSTPALLRDVAPASTQGNVPVPMTTAPMNPPVADEALDEIWRTTLQDEMHARTQRGAGADLVADWHRVAPAYIALLPSQSVPESSSLQRFECSICLESYEVGEDVLTLPCAHLVHTICGTEWLSRNNACPSCTTPIVS